MTLTGVRIAGTGSYLPPRVVTNEELSRTLETTDEWIRTRTGIRERRFAAAGEAASDMALAAARPALEAAGVRPDDVDLIICATMTGDYVIPSTAGMIQRGLGAARAGGYDLGGACSGFVLGLSAAAGYVKWGAARCVLLVGSEKMTGVVDPQDRSTAVLFGDGAGAAVLVPSPDATSDVLAVRHGLHGDEQVLSIPCGGSRRPSTVETLAERGHYVKMQGRETFKFAVKSFVSLIEDTCRDAGISPQDLAVIVPHQVNQRILEAAVERAHVDLARCVVNIDRVGNTSGASVGIALDEAVRGGRIKAGDLVLLLAFGAGLTWASALVRW